MLYLTGIADTTSRIDLVEDLYRQLTDPSREKRKPVIQEDMPVEEVVEIIVGRLMEAATRKTDSEEQEIIIESAP